MLPLMGLFYCLACLAAIVMFVRYTALLKSCLSRCSPEHRTLRPALVWLQVIPVLGAAWQFMVVGALSKSVGAEQSARCVAQPRQQLRSLGFAKASIDVVVLVAVLVMITALRLVPDEAWKSTPWSVIGPSVASVVIFGQVACVALWASYHAAVRRALCGLSDDGAG
jgi:hypothetical protein